jgi:hypothetical protein
MHRDYEISRKAGDNMYTVKTITSNGKVITNYFATEQECINNVYFIWENEKFFQLDSDKLLSKAILECKEIDSKNPNLRQIL